MSVLRFLSPRRPSRPSSPSPSSSRRRRPEDLEPRLSIHIPSYGSFFMDSSCATYNEPDAVPEAGPSATRTDKEARGELEVEIPHGMGRRRVKAIRVGIKTVVELTLGPHRVNERDTIFERKVEVKGGNADGIILEGVQRFGFTLILPSKLCTHDRHSNGRITHCIYAEVEGLPDARSSSRTRDTSPRSGRSRSPLTSGSATPLDDIYAAVNPASLSAALSSMSITRQETAYLPAPPYSGSAIGVEWLKGTITKERYSEILHNSHPDGGVTELDVLVQDVVPGLGPFNIRLLSDCWTIGAFLLATLTFPDPSPTVAIYTFRLLFIQTHAILSPRDDPNTTERLKTTQHYTVFDLGDRPTARLPAVTSPALWRGREAGGDGHGQVTIPAKGRNPRDDKARPTSIRGIPTPIEVSHRIHIEVLFSVWNEDEHGQALEVPGPGAVRALMVEKPTVIASCAFTPEEMRLPTYGSLLHQDAFSVRARKCPLCGKDPPDKLCTACPPTSIPHPRHDHDPKLVGNDEGICPSCTEEVIPRREPGPEDCACGMSDEYLEERMKRREQVGGITDIDALRQDWSRKGEEERGRRPVGGFR